MKVFIFAFFATVTAAARLENTYLPPASAQNAGGNENLLRTPFASGQQQSSPLRFGSAPSPAYGAPSSSRSFGPSGQPFAILRFNNENYGDGNYRFEYETENQIRQAETGEQRNAGTDQASSIVQGSYSYAGDDGNTYTVNYVADENGFRPEGAHLPTPPPIPAAILKSLEINAAEEAAGIRYDDSGYSTGAGGRSNQFGGSSAQYGAGTQFGSGQFNAATGSQFSSGQFSAVTAGPAARTGFNPQTGYNY